MTASHLEQQVRTRLAAHGVRYTSGRKDVVAAISASEGPRSAAELHTVMKRSVPLSSLYRSLSIMTDAEVLAPHHGPQGVTRYELAEWLVGHHHHLVCVDCGSVDDIELPEALESALEGVVSTAAEIGGFTAAGHALEIDGRCAACA